ncbi:uncharacterized protein LOC129777645 [Toxorhynchites rutilus septentrionalis]|uniref:uncharacterized protein LOC129777645 n=1 Tax=Toxorhynchites rutilus septentrionalis TaxID=329112 RepID=UPI002479F5C9|nr:uncharacterized protein LOC129777645 [Toxorhynchites rutilus septentrionalis]
MNIVGKSQAVLISGTIEVLRSLQSPLQFELTLHRCEVDKTKCEHFDTISFDDVCALYNENHLIRSFVGFFSPPLTCPVQVGKYVAKDGVLDMKAFEIFPIGNTHWQTEMRLIDASKQIVSCIRSETTITSKH